MAGRPIGKAWHEARRKSRERKLTPIPDAFAERLERAEKALEIQQADWKRMYDERERAEKDLAEATGLIDRLSDELEYVQCVEKRRWVCCCGPSEAMREGYTGSLEVEVVPASALEAAERERDFFRDQIAQDVLQAEIARLTRELEAEREVSSAIQGCAEHYARENAALLAAVEQEREACAKIAEEWKGSNKVVEYAIADAIRARKP